jgi:hypothetical protein
MSTLEPVSGQVGLCFPGKVIFGGRDRTATTLVEAPCEKSRDQVDPAEGANTGCLAPLPGNLCGAVAIRTRTTDPLSWVCGVCAEKSRLPDRQSLSRPGTVGVYLGTQRVHKGGQQIDFRCVTHIDI